MVFPRNTMWSSGGIRKQRLRRSSVFPNAYFIDEKDGKWYVMIRDARPVQEEGSSVQEQVLCFLLSRRGGGGKTVAGYR